MEEQRVRISDIAQELGLTLQVVKDNCVWTQLPHLQPTYARGYSTHSHNRARRWNVSAVLELQRWQAQCPRVLLYVCWNAIVCLLPSVRSIAELEGKTHLWKVTREVRIPLQNRNGNVLQNVASSPRIV